MAIRREQRGTCGLLQPNNTIRGDDPVPPPLSKAQVGVSENGLVAGITAPGRRSGRPVEGTKDRLLWL